MEKKYKYGIGIFILGLIVWIFFQGKELRSIVKDKEAQKIELQHDLDSIMTQYNIVKITSGFLNKELETKDSIIRANAEEIRSLLNTKYEYNKIYKKFISLQKITQGYVHQIDSLYSVNKKLKLDNESMYRKNLQERNKNILLIKDREELKGKIKDASYFTIYDITAKTYKIKNNKKEIITDRSKKIEKIKISFILGENILVPIGKKIIYLRIIQPDQSIMNDKNGNKFLFNKQYVSYTSSQEITHDGKLKFVVIDVDKDRKSLKKGIYIIDVFIDDRFVGENKFELK